MSRSKPTESDQGVSDAALASDDQALTTDRIYLQQLNLPLRQPVRCVVCGAPFEIVRQRGRPQKFCSDVCRGTRHQQQKNAWNIQQKGKSTNG